MKRAAWAILLAGGMFVLVGCEGKGSAQAPEPAQVEKKRPEFNTSDKSVESNNNFGAAALKVSETQGDELWANAEKVQVDRLTKSPYSAIGKVFKVTGEIYKVEELPANNGRQGHWSEILMMTRNSNAPAGASTISYIYNGDISNINANQVVTCAGYFVGTYKSQNMMGGEVEGLVLVGNKVVKR